MQSFRTELENPIVEKDIVELADKISLFKNGKIDEDKFRSLRLARGVYGQRQAGVQMIRIKLPFGKMTFEQWNRICAVSDEYSTGNLHLTTRQDIQIHYVSLDRTPQLWAELEKDDVTLREACGNTVRNVTASETAGVDPNEPFDVTPYAKATFQYFLRNPICQEMGRKFKISFSSSDEDTALSYIHDLGFIPKIKDGKKGFKVLLAGGLGSQPRLADVMYEFLEVDQLIPLIETTLRVFDRYGERKSRSKARMKFLLAKGGIENFMELIDQERKANKVKVYKIEIDSAKKEELAIAESPATEDVDYLLWKATNTFAQKQKGMYGVYIRIPLGNITTKDSRQLIGSLKGYIENDIRVTINQNLFLRGIPEANLFYVYTQLKKVNYALSGANSVANITACPGTDTCNLAISDSTHVSKVFEKLIETEFKPLLEENNIKIKISGCMNSCGQHGMAQIGFHGSSMKSPDKKVMPALQVLLGGGTVGDGQGRVAEKIIKVPSKRGPEVLRAIFSDYTENSVEGQYFNDYFDQQGKIYFYDLLKPLADLTSIIDTDFIDWGRDELFKTEIGVGECAGVIIDLVGTLLFESEEKLDLAKQSFEAEDWADAIYYSYASQVNTAKALLLGEGKDFNTQAKVIAEFSKFFGEYFGTETQENILKIRNNEPSQSFAREYINQGKLFLNKALEFKKEVVDA